MDINGGKIFLIWGGYYRKSSEAREKQALSITDQKKEVHIITAQNDIRLKYEFEESKTAFKPHKRAVFDNVIELIESGKMNAWAVWKEDRISRNPEEGGKVLQLLQDGKLKMIFCVSSNTFYTPDSDHLILQIHFGMANQYSRNLSQNVRRGLLRKVVDRKEYPRPAILGFQGYGERGSRNIKPHPLEGPFIVKAFETASTGLYSISQINEILYNEGFRTKKGKRISKSHLHTILVCPTYYGYFYRNGELYEGGYQPLISKGLFDLVQEKLKDRSKPRKMIWDREFVGLIHCANCGCTVTTSIKKKYVKKAGVYQNYVYHHCTHKRNKCKQQPITDSELKDMLYKAVDQISIDLEVWQLGIKLVRAKNSEELQKNKYQLQTINKQQQIIRDQINTLIEMRADRELTKDEFLEQKNRLLEKLSSFDNQALDNSHSVKTWLELMEDFFDTAYQARELIEKGTPEEKQIVLSKIGQNFLLKDKQLTFSFKKPYDVLLNPALRTNGLRDLDSNQDR